MNVKALPILFAVCLSVFSVCGASGRAEAREAKGTCKKTVVLGLIPERNLFKQMDRYEPLAAYLAEKTGTRIRLVVLARYGNVVDNFVSEGLDGAFFGSFTYALAHAILDVQVLARPEDSEGASTYHGLIFVRKDGKIKSYRQMRGKRFAFVDKACWAGYLFPVAYFQKRGVDYRTYLKEIYLTGTHEDAIYDVLNRKADIGAAKNTVFDRLSASDPRVRKELTVLDRSIDVPENALALRKDFDAALRQAFKAALLNMHLDPQGEKILRDFGAKRFVETTDADYLPIYRSAQGIRLDLATYDYRDDL